MHNSRDPDHHNRNRRSERGSSNLLEYGLVVALVAVMAIPGMLRVTRETVETFCRADTVISDGFNSAFGEMGTGFVVWMEPSFGFPNLRPGMYCFALGNEGDLVGGPRRYLTNHFL